MAHNVANNRGARGMEMTLDGQIFEQWMESLKKLAEEAKLDLKLQQCHYHSWFSHGYTPDAVISDMRETVAGSDG